MKSKEEKQFQAECKALLKPTSQTNAIKIKLDQFLEIFLLFLY